MNRRARTVPGLIADVAVTRLLLVDDSEVFRERLARAFRERGFAVRTAGGYDEAMASAREHAPHQNAPACTIVGAVVTSGLLVVGWVGDSRAYWVPVDRSAAPARLTEDDSWAAQMVAAGLMSEAEAYADERAHAITGWLGADAVDLDPHTVSFQPDRPGVIIVCTDGLWNYAESAAELAAAVGDQARARPLSCARALVGLALLALLNGESPPLLTRLPVELIRRQSVAAPTSKDFRT